MRHSLFLLYVCFVVCAWCDRTPAPLVRIANGRRYPIPIPTAKPFLNAWPQAEETRFMEKAARYIEVFGHEPNRGSTVNEREKDLYPRAMAYILAGREAQGAKALMMPQKYDPPQFHAFTGGFDFWFGFTLKGQVRKYFLFGPYLTDDYRRRFEDAFKRWT
ncbi:MAG: hypothetical protein D6820_06060, partial [Lentisphaerae bacterium]